MLIQQRQPFKKHWSDMWDLSAGGAATQGDNSQKAAEREVFEELGLILSLDNIDPSLTIHADSAFGDVYLIEKDLDISELKLQPEEVKTAKWATKEDIYNLLDEGVFIPYHKSLLNKNLIFSQLLQNHRERSRHIVTSETYHICQHHSKIGLAQNLHRTIHLGNNQSQNTKIGSLRHAESLHVDRVASQDLGHLVDTACLILQKD
jgi:isopentenyldiphosphate isomerase